MAYVTFHLFNLVIWEGSNIVVGHLLKESINNLLSGFGVVCKLAYYHSASELLIRTRRN